MALKIKIKVFQLMKMDRCHPSLKIYTLNDLDIFFCGFVLFYLFLSAVALLNNLIEDFKLGEKLTDCSNETLYEQQF